MDGGQVTSRIRDRLRKPTVLLGASLAMIPAAVLFTGSSKADTAPASIRYAVGSVGMQVAQDIARQTWGVDPCAGQVEIVWGTDEPLVNARSYWANPYSAYDHAELNTQCRIVFNRDLDFSWQKLCTVVVHEYGHLAGRAHTADGPDVMSPIYRAPLPACVATPDPAAPVPPPAPAPAPEITPSPVTTEGVIDAPIGRSKRSKPRAGARAAAKATHRARPRARVDAPPLQRFEEADRALGSSLPSYL
ncbi:MAG TPA: hypothetical protein VFR97_13840 [Capillimicrobium sp.]|nr:hypothetical protein [Capillimicrobium sp.]